MDKTKILPTVMILIDVGAAVVYGMGHDWKKGYLLDSCGSA